MDSTSPAKSHSSESDDESFKRQTRSQNLRINSRRPIFSKYDYTPESYNPNDDSEDSDDDDGAQRTNLYPNLKEMTQSPEKKEPAKSPEKVREKTPHPTKVDGANNQSPSIAYGIVILVLIAAVGIYFMRSTNINAEVPKTPKKTVDCSEFMTLNESFPNQDRKLFKSLQAGIEGMYKRTPQVPSVVTFFSTDEEAIKSVLSDVVKIARKCIKQNANPIAITSEDLNTPNFFEDNRRVISKYKDELKERTIMIISNVDQVKSTVVGSLHSFADTVNPLVSESILYLTVKVPKEPADKANYIYTFLQNQWKELASHIRDPLITRLIDQAFYINSAK